MARNSGPRHGHVIDAPIGGSQQHGNHKHQRAAHPSILLPPRPAMLPKGKPMVTRRELLRTSGLLTAAAASGAAAPLASGAGWFDRPMRWAQLNSTEDDAAQMDIPFWMDYFRRMHADALCITAGGVVAFYPTKLKYHHPSRWLAERPDYFSAGAGRLPQTGHGRRRAHRPARHLRGRLPTSTRTGSPWTPRAASAATGPAPELWVTCALGPYNFEFMTEVTREIVSTFPQVDGIFSNRWAGSGMCYCEHCRRNLPRHSAAWTCRARTTRATPPAATTSSGASSASSSCGGCGTARSARSTPTRAISPTPAAAP